MPFEDEIEELLTKARARASDNNAAPSIREAIDTLAEAISRLAREVAKKADGDQGTF